MVLTAERTAPANGSALHGAGRGDAWQSLSFTAMGTGCEVVFAAPSPSRAAAFRSACRAWVEDFESSFSAFRTDSFVSAVNRSAGEGWVAAGREAESLFALCDWFHWLTRGVFDPTAKPLTDLWDWHRPHDSAPTVEEVAARRALVGWPRVERRPGAVRLPQPGMALDLGGFGKEYALDRAAALAEDAGIVDYLLNFGNDVRVHGRAPQGGPWMVGVEDPRRPGRCWAGLAIGEGAVCTSGNYLRYVEIAGERFGHIVDPRTGHPAANGVLSATVLAPTATEAGILAKAAVILGPEEGLALLARRFGVEGCVVTEQGVRATGGFRNHVAHDRN